MISLRLSSVKLINCSCASRAALTAESMSGKIPFPATGPAGWVGASFVDDSLPGSPINPAMREAIVSICAWLRGVTSYLLA